MNIIKLTNYHSKSSIYVNADSILYFSPGFKEGQDITAIYFTDNQDVKVLESADKLYSMLTGIEHKVSTVAAEKYVPKNTTIMKPKKEA